MGRLTTLSSNSWVSQPGAVSGTSHLGVKKMTTQTLAAEVGTTITHELGKQVCGVYITNEADNANLVMSVVFDPIAVSNTLVIYNDSASSVVVTVFIYYAI